MNPITFRHLAIGVGMLKTADLNVAIFASTGYSSNEEALVAIAVLVFGWLFSWAFIWKVTAMKAWIRPVSASDALAGHGASKRDRTGQ